MLEIAAKLLAPVPRSTRSCSNSPALTMRASTPKRRSSSMRHFSHTVLGQTINRVSVGGAQQLENGFELEGVKIGIGRFHVVDDVIEAPGDADARQPTSQPCRFHETAVGETVGQTFGALSTGSKALTGSQETLPSPNWTDAISSPAMVLRPSSCTTPARLGSVIRRTIIRG